MVGIEREVGSQALELSTETSAESLPKRRAHQVTDDPRTRQRFTHSQGAVRERLGRQIHADSLDHHQHIVVTSKWREVVTQVGAAEIDGDSLEWIRSSGGRQSLFLECEESGVIEFPPVPTLEPESSRIEARAENYDSEGRVLLQSAANEVINDTVSCDVARGRPSKAQSRTQPGTCVFVDESRGETIIANGLCTGSIRCPQGAAVERGERER